MRYELQRLPTLASDGTEVASVQTISSSVGQPVYVYFSGSTGGASATIQITGSVKGFDDVEKAGSYQFNLMCMASGSSSGVPLFQEKSPTVTLVSGSVNYICSGSTGITTDANGDFRGVLGGLTAGGKYYLMAEPYNVVGYKTISGLVTAKA